MVSVTKYRESNFELVRMWQKNERVFLYIGTFFIIVMGLSIVFLLVMTFLMKLGAQF
jgi:hypothetical protein